MLFLFLVMASFLFISPAPAGASTIPATHSAMIPPGAFYKKIASLKVKDLQKMLGRKLTLKEKVSFFILKQKVRHKAKESNSDGQSAFIVGLVALGLLVIGLFVPYVIVGSLVAAILAIVMGSMTKKKNPDDPKAKAGQLLGWITLGLIALLLIIAAIIISSWTWI